MTITVDRDVDLMLVAGNGVGWATDKGAAAPAAPANPGLMPVSTFVPLGSCTEDGLSIANSDDRTELKVWGILTSFRTLITSSTRTFKLTLRETQRDICISLMYRKTLAELAKVSGVRSFADTSTPGPDRRSFLFKAIDGAIIQQFYIPVGEVTDRGDINYKADDSASFELTITAYPDSIGNTLYISDNAPATPIGSNS